MWTGPGYNVDALDIVDMRPGAEVDCPCNGSTRRHRELEALL
jgi:hypothetical protein